MLTEAVLDRPEGPTWADQLEAWATLGGAVVALAAAVATIVLLFHQMSETAKARKDADDERASAAADRELARQDRELAREDRRDREAAQARTVVIDDYTVGPRSGEAGIRVGLTIGNYSAEPILSATVVVDNGLGDFYKVWSKSLIPPGGRETVSLQLRPTRAVKDLAEYRPEIHFTDSRGQRWSRLISSSPIPGRHHNEVWNYPDVRLLEAKELIQK